MIVIVALVVALAAAITAWVTGGVAFAWIAVALALGVIAAIVVRAVRGRRSSGAGTSAEPVVMTGTGDTVEEPVGDARSPEPAHVEEPTAVEQEEASGAAPVGVTDVVHVLPGRRRFHRAGCELIVDRETDDIALDDARDEGFSACSVCHGVTARH